MKSRWVGLGLLGILSCSSSEPSPAPAPAADGGTTPAGTPLTVWIYAQPIKPGEKPAPLAGATVAFDPAEGGGERVEVTTDAEGKATANVDLTKGPATVSAVAPNTFVVSALEITPENVQKLPPNPFGKPSTDLVLLLGANGKGQIANSVEVSGNFTGKADSGNNIGLASTGVYGGYEIPGGNFAVRVPKGIPFSFMCFEGPPADLSVPRSFDRASLRVFRVDHAAVDANTTFDIDVAQGTLQTTTVHWRVEAPGGDTGPLGGTSVVFANVLSFDSGANTGFFRHIAPTPDKNAFDVEEVIAQTDLAPEVVRSIAVIQNTDGAASARQELGNAPEGYVFKDYLAPPAVSITKQTLNDPIALDGVPEAAEAVNINFTSGPDLEWVILGPYKKKPASPLKIPTPPSTAKLPPTYKAQIIALSDFTDIPGRPGGMFPKKIAFSRPIGITK